MSVVGGEKHTVPYRILVLEDEALARTTLSFVLKNKGYHVAEAADGYAGVKLARVFRPDLVVTDMIMPGMDGVEVCRQLRRDPITKDIPILVISNMADKRHVVAAVEAGATDHLVKTSFSVCKFLHRVRDKLVAK